MILYPAIHIKDGQVARLTREGGDLSHTEILHADPAARALEFAAQKFAWLHVVDLNGAFEGRPANKDSVIAILKNVKVPVQLSGGIRDAGTVEYWLDQGIARVVLTAMALHQTDLALDLCRRFPGRLAVKIDSRQGYVTKTGWTKATDIRALDLALRFENSGAAAIIYADINNDGALAEINTEAIIDLAFALTTPVIASGGVNSLQDLAALKANSRAGIAGLILGGALYSGKIRADEALKLAAA